MAKHKVIIGRNEEIDIVGKALSIPAKIDTGAFRSAIHCSSTKVVTKKGKPVLKFVLFGHPVRRVAIPMEATEFSKVPVMSSNGTTEDRYEVSLKIKIGPKIFFTSFSLADRSGNVFPVLIGRKALKNRFVVDVSTMSVDRRKLRESLGGVSIESDDEDWE